MLRLAVPIGIIICASLNAFAGEDAKARVNYHLRDVENTIEERDIDGKVKGYKINTNDLKEPDPSEVYMPNYGLGEAVQMPESSVVDRPAPGLAPAEPPNVEDQIRRETASQRHRGNSYGTQSEGMTREEYIEQYKKNAAKRGIKVYVDPNTLEVREVK